MNTDNTVFERTAARQRTMAQQTMAQKTMAMPATVAQARVSRDLDAAEAALDEALVRQASLLSTMVTARREAGLPPFLGQDVLCRLVRSQTALVDAGNQLARVHGGLRAIAVTTLGGNDPCPSRALNADEPVWDEADPAGAMARVA